MRGSTELEDLSQQDKGARHEIERGRRGSDEADVKLRGGRLRADAVKRVGVLLGLIALNCIVSVVSCAVPMCLLRDAR